MRARFSQIAQVAHELNAEVIGPSGVGPFGAGLPPKPPASLLWESGDAEVRLGRERRTRRGPALRCHPPWEEDGAGLLLRAASDLEMKRSSFRADGFVGTRWLEREWRAPSWEGRRR